MDSRVIGEIIMLIFAVMISLVMLYGGYMMSRPFDLEPKEKKTS